MVTLPLAHSAPSATVDNAIASSSSSLPLRAQPSIPQRHFVLPPYLTTPSSMTTVSSLADKQSTRKKAKDATSVGGLTAIARSLMMQSLYLFHIGQLFRPLRVDYLVMARALMPVNDATAGRFSFRYTSIGMISHAVKTKGWSFIPRHILPPLLANTAIGTALYSTYIVSLPFFHPPCALQLHRPFPPPQFSSVFFAGCLAGAAQSIIATPLDSLKVRFEVSDLLEGKHRSMYRFAASTLKELGVASAYRGFTLTLLRDSLACGLFFATFEWVKQQGYYYFLDEIYGFQINSSNSLIEMKNDWLGKSAIDPEINRENSTTTLVQQSNKPPMLLEPMFVIFAGAAAAVAYQLIEHPFSKIHSIFYIEEGQSEFSTKSSREPVNVLYRRTWEQCKLQVRLNGGSWRKFLYHEFGTTVIKVVPATSVGFLVFELMKRNIDFKRVGFDQYLLDVE